MEILGRSIRPSSRNLFPASDLKTEGLPGGPVVKTLGSQHRSGGGCLVAKLNSGGLGSVLGHGTRSHMLQPRVPMWKLKISKTSTKAQHTQISK